MWIYKHEEEVANESFINRKFLLTSEVSRTCKFMYMEKILKLLKFVKNVNFLKLDFC